MKSVFVLAAVALVGFSRTYGTPITFNKDVAPILFEHCAICHRPGQSAPFLLLTYEDARKRARFIADVTARRYMPPWLPEPGCGEFAGKRGLSETEIGVLRQWSSDRAVAIWSKPATVCGSPSWKGRPEPRALCEALADKISESDSLLSAGLAHENPHVVTYCLLALDLARS